LKCSNIRSKLLSGALIVKTVHHPVHHPVHYSQISINRTLTSFGIIKPIQPDMMVHHRYTFGLLRLNLSFHRFVKKYLLEDKVQFYQYF
jgi:hypothetical protein